MTPLAEHVAARWLDQEAYPLPLNLHGHVIPLRHDWSDTPATIPGYWLIEEGVGSPVWSTRPDATGQQHGPLRPDHQGRYRVTCDDGVRRRLTLNQLRGDT